MTQLSTFGGVVVPSPTEAATIPADMLAIVNQFCGTATSPARVNAIVSSQAERDGNYAGYPAGGLVVCPQAKTIWMSLGIVSGTQRWQTIYVDTGWVTAGFSIAPNWAAAASNSVLVRRKGPIYNLRVGVIWNGDSPLTGGPYNDTNPGNIVDTPVITGMPDGYTPKETYNATFRGTYTSGSAFLSPTGVVTLADMHPSSKILTGQGVTMQFIWLADD